MTAGETASHRATARAVEFGHDTLIVCDSLLRRVVLGQLLRR